MCLHVYVCVYVYIYVCTHTYVHVCTYVYVCAHTFIYVCVYVYIYVCVYVCTYVYCNDSLRYIIISMQFPATHIFAHLTDLNFKAKKSLLSKGAITFTKLFYT